MRLGRFRILGLGLVAVALLAGPVAGASAAGVARIVPAPSAPRYIVTFRPGATGSEGPALTLATARGRAVAEARARATDQAIDTLEDALGFQATFRYRFALQGFSAPLSSAQVRTLRASELVAGVMRSRPITVAAELQPVPKDVLRVHGAPSGPSPASDVQVDVAVIDTGIGPVGGGELNIQPASAGMNCAADAHPSNWIRDGYGHGTHVSGTIGARDNGIGIVGVAPGARLWAVRVFDANGHGSDDTVICGIEWATAWKLDVANAGKPLVANMSLRGPAPLAPQKRCGELGDTDPEHLAICGGVAAGVIFVVAAGNESDTVRHWIPSRYEEVITVSAISDFDGIAGGQSSSSDVPGCVPPAGPESDDAFSRYSNYGDDVDITAPGTCVRSTVASTASGAITKLMSGTSMATPHVTGAVARYLEIHPLTAPDDMRALLVATGNVDWEAGSDPDGTPDRLLDVDALVAASPGLAVWPAPARVNVAAGTTGRTVRMELQRIGGYAGSVQVAATNLPPGVAASTPGSVSGLDGIHADVMLTIGSDAAEGSHTLTIEGAGSGGDPASSATLSLRIDRTAPLVLAPWPSAALRGGGTFTQSTAIRLAWGASDPGGAIARTELQRAIADGGFARIASTTASTAGTTIMKGKDYRFRIRTIDHVGNATFSTALSTRLTTRQSNSTRIVWSSGWRTRARTTASGGSLRTSERVGATAELDFSGRSIALVAPIGPGKGVARVLIDGSAVATIHLRAEDARARRIVFASGQLDPGPHHLTIEVRSGRVDVDALLILR